MTAARRFSHAETNGPEVGFQDISSKPVSGQSHAIDNRADREKKDRKFCAARAPCPRMPLGIVAAMRPVSFSRSSLTVRRRSRSIRQIMKGLVRWNASPGSLAI